MAELIKAKTRLDAWNCATTFLLRNGTELDLILEIQDPVSGGRNPLIDEFLAREGQFPMHTVAETIFPAVEYRNRGIQGVLEFYPDEVYPAIKSHPSIRWGTYAYRLVRRRNARGQYVNPLKQMIEKMRDEVVQPGPKKSCYEIGVAEGEYDLPLYDPASDGTRRMGGPCLSHLSFKLVASKVHLTAVYRSHDYGFKVPGNLLGLARLQACVATETGLGIGGLVVHSTYAFVNGSKTRIRALLEQLRQTDVSMEAQSAVVH